MATNEARYDHVDSRAPSRAADPLAAQDAERSTRLAQGRFDHSQTAQHPRAEAPKPVYRDPAIAEEAHRNRLRYDHPDSGGPAVEAVMARQAPAAPVAAAAPAEHVAADDATVSGLVEVARAAGVDLDESSAALLATAQQEQLVTSLNAKLAEDRAAVEAHPDLGGAHLAETMSYVQDALAKFDASGALREKFAFAGNDPDLIKFLRDLGRHLHRSV